MFLGTVSPVPLFSRFFKLRIPQTMAIALPITPSETSSQSWADENLWRTSATTQTALIMMETVSFIRLSSTTLQVGNLKSGIFADNYI